MNGIYLKGYYSQDRSRGCYGAALSNLLVSLGDENTARRIFDAYPMHRLVGEEGEMHVGVATRILRDLTDGMYEGTLYTHFADLEQSTRAHFGEKADEILETIREETSLEYVQGHEGHTAYSGHPLFWILRKPGGHWVVPNIEEDSYIDNGIRRWPIEKLEVIGILEVRKRNPI